MFALVLRHILEKIGAYQAHFEVGASLEQHGAHTGRGFCTVSVLQLECAIPVPDAFNIQPLKYVEHFQCRRGLPCVRSFVSPHFAYSAECCHDRRVSLKWEVDFVSSQINTDNNSGGILGVVGQN